MPKTSILQDKDAVEAAIKVATSIKHALTLLGLRAAGGNYRAFKIACQKFDLEPPVQDYTNRTQNAIASRTIPIEDILVENSAYTNRYQIKKRGIEAGLLRNECYGCGIGPEWQGLPLTLQLEHCNGIWNDHRIDNLALLCPNCHSQTDTYCGRNFKKNS